MEIKILHKKHKSMSILDFVKGFKTILFCHVTKLNSIMYTRNATLWWLWLESLVD